MEVVAAAVAAEARSPEAAAEGDVDEAAGAAERAELLLALALTLMMTASVLPRCRLWRAVAVGAADADAAANVVAAGEGVVERLQLRAAGW